ncbi:MAG: phasin family protein [Acidobacteria bacterium]|nr:phasin family protein [Acidobacteriota bacterium]
MTEGIMAEGIGEVRRSKDPAVNLPYEAAKTGSTKRTSASNQAPVVSNQEFSPLEDRYDLDAFLQANEAIMKGMAALNLEMMDFGKRRLDECTGRSESLMRCKDAEQAVCIESDFARTATLQYLDHSYNVLATVTKMTEEFLTPLHELVKKALEDLTKETGPSEMA